MLSDQAAYSVFRDQVIEEFDNIRDSFPQITFDCGFVNGEESIESIASGNNYSGNWGYIIAIIPKSHYKLACCCANGKDFPDDGVDSNYGLGPKGYCFDILTEDKENKWLLLHHAGLDGLALIEGNIVSCRWYPASNTEESPATLYPKGRPSNSAYLKNGTQRILAITQDGEAKMFSGFTGAYDDAQKSIYNPIWAQNLLDGELDDGTWLNAAHKGYWNAFEIFNSIIVDGQKTDHNEGYSSNIAEENRPYWEKKDRYSSWNLLGFDENYYYDMLTVGRTIPSLGANWTMLQNFLWDKYLVNNQYNGPDWYVFGGGGSSMLYFGPTKRNLCPWASVTSGGDVLKVGQSRRNGTFVGFQRINLDA